MPSSFTRALYYSFKPVLPWRLRLTGRRLVAHRIRRAFAATWPIDEAAGRTPEGWPGWPEGKQFAFVLTHDVEGPEGLAKVQRLAELEMSLGFRSSFNFIPEGDYEVPPALRSWLIDHGFEVGVHDLHHDGKLYRSRSVFRERAAKINRYLKEWGAVGYRSGFMLHNYDWHHDLEVAYDASSFDTDPFEPQPDGVGTIFPFWVPAPDGAGAGTGKGQEASGKGPDGGDTAGKRQEASGKSADASRLPLPPSQYSAPPHPSPLPLTTSPSASSHPSPFPLTSYPATPHSRRDGYVELPYTLPQDSTLFFVLKEPGPEIWLRKLDWIARQGGMALVNVHPDYVRFSGEAGTAHTFPVEHYAQLLRQVRDAHAGTCWHRLPREVATFTSELSPRPVFRKPRRIGMVTHSYYQSDNRVIRYAESLAARGDHVDIFALRWKQDGVKEEVINGVHLFRIHDRPDKNERSKLAYLLPLLRFLFKAAGRVARHHARQPYDCLHIHNIPDFMVFSGWYPKLTGTGLLLDIHDIVPEFFASKFGKGTRGAFFTALRWMERASAAFADHVIIANDLWREKYAARTRTDSRCTVFINNVDTRVFKRYPRTRTDDRLIVMFPGGLQWHQGVDLAIRAFPQVVQAVPNAEFHIYGAGITRESLVALTAELGMQEHVRFFEPTSLEQIAPIMAQADLGVVPKRADSFGNEAYSTKIMEFMAVGVPLVISSTKVDRFYFTDDVVRFFESGNVDALAAAIIELLRDSALRQRYVANASAYVQQHCWETRKTEYLALVDSLCEGRRGAAAGDV